MLTIQAILIITLVYDLLLLLLFLKKIIIKQYDAIKCFNYLNYVFRGFRG